MERSLFSRLYDVMRGNGQFKNSYSITKQYRMHPEICSFPNKYFYGNRLKSEQTLNDTKFALHPYNVFRLSCTQTNNGTFNYYNEEEASFIVDLLKVMVRHVNPTNHSYGIITPYSTQRTIIKNLLR